MVLCVIEELYIGVWYGLLWYVRLIVCVYERVVTNVFVRERFVKDVWWCGECILDNFWNFF